MGDGLDGLLEALGRLIAERFQQTATQQTDNLLTGGGNLLDAFLTKLLGLLSGSVIEWAVRAFFLILGVTARALLLAFGDQAAFLQGILVGAPWELTAGVPEVQRTTLVVQAIAVLCLPLAITWSGFGYMFSFAEGGSQGFAKRLLQGGVLVGLIPRVLDVTLRFVDQLGKALAAAGDAVPGYASMSDAVAEGIVVAAALTPPVSGAPAGALSQTLLALGDNATVVAGAMAFVYALAIVMGGSSAAARIVVLDALYVLSPLAALMLVTPIGGPIFALWARAWGACLFIVLPAGMALKLGSGLIVAFAAGGPFWVAVMATVAVGVYAVLVGRTAFGLGRASFGTTRRIVHVVAGR